MKRINSLLGLMLLVFMIMSCGKSSVKPKPGPGINLVLSATEQQQATADNAFSFNLFKTVQSADNSGSNLFLSPLSVSMAIGMASNGANGATLDGIKSTLDFSGFTQDQINTYYNKLITDLPRLDPQTTLNIANSIWYKQGLDVSAQFLKTNSTYFDAQIQALDFSNPSSAGTINNWVSKQTNGKIPLIVDQISPNDMMYLVNAIYFKSIWQSKFDPAQTHQQAFHLSDQSTVQTDFMQGNSITYNVYTDNDKLVAELPYINGKYSMTIVSPNGNNTLNNVTQSLDTTIWNSWMKQLHNVTGPVIMPKFKFNYSVLLNNALSGLGMGDAFSNSADFTGISSAGGLQITKVQHEAFVAVDETGTEAAAATSVVIGSAAVAATPTLLLDHPFFFVIREMKTGLILFAGTVNNPQLAGQYKPIH